MATGTIASLKNDSVGYISTPRRADFRFDRKDFKSDVAWDRDTLVGKAVEFSPVDGSNACSVRLV